MLPKSVREQLVKGVVHELCEFEGRCRLDPALLEHVDLLTQTLVVLVLKTLPEDKKTLTQADVDKATAQLGLPF